MSNRLKKALATAAKKTAGSAPKDGEFSKSYPILWDFLTVTVVDGEARDTATLTISCDRGDLKGFLNDRGSLQFIAATSDTVAGVFEALEATLGSENPGWRQSNFDRKAPTKKK